MHQVVNGLVIRATPYREADAILTVLTSELGLITVKAPGIRGKSARRMAAGQMFAYSSMTLYERAGRYTLTEADVIRQFHGLSADIVNISLASYFAEILGTEAEKAPAHPDIIRLALNAFHALADGGFGTAAVKAAFELRYMALCGYTPLLGRCATCGGHAQSGWFVPALGQVVCVRCGRPQGGVMLDSAALQAAGYIVSAPVSRVFSFKISDESLVLLCEMSEIYLLHCMERGFKTLSFYKSL